MKSQGFNTGFHEESPSLATLVQPNTVTSMGVSPSHQGRGNTQQGAGPRSGAGQSHDPCVGGEPELPEEFKLNLPTLNLEDIMEDEVSGLSADPMLSSQGFVDDGMEYTLME